MKIFKCKKCGNIVFLINENSNNLACCGEAMIELKANTVDAAKEKHVPVVKIDNNKIDINIGVENHPMTDEHFIEYVIIETNKGIKSNNLIPGDEPHTSFLIDDDERILNTYAYCNLHGLWKS